jgi:hypothetical protein
VLSRQDTEVVASCCKQKGSYGVVHRAHASLRRIHAHWQGLYKWMYVRVYVSMCMHVGMSRPWSSHKPGRGAFALPPPVCTANSTHIQIAHKP